MIYAGVPKQHSLYTLCNVGSNAELVQTECSLVPRPTNNRKHCRFGYETRHYIALLRPIIIFDIIIIYIIYTALLY